FEPGEYEISVIIPSGPDAGRTVTASSKIQIVSDVTTTVSIILKNSKFLEVKSATIGLHKLRLEHFSLKVLTDGFHIRPNFLRIAFEDNGELSSKFPVDLLDSFLEPINRSEDVSFRYTIFDSGT